jgi:hypothetical protein
MMDKFENEDGNYIPNPVWIGVVGLAGKDRTYCFFSEGDALKWLENHPKARLWICSLEYPTEMELVPPTPASLRLKEIDDNEADNKNNPPDPGSTGLGAVSHRPGGGGGGYAGSVRVGKGDGYATKDGVGVADYWKGEPPRITGVQ